MPTSNSTEAAAALTRGDGFVVRRTESGVVLQYPVLRAPGVALSLAAFALLCGLMPALGLSALLPLDSANAAAMVSLALIGGFAAPFMLASGVFAALAVYLAANSLRVEIDADGVRSERRVFGVVTRLRDIARDTITGIEPRIGARYQNVFSSTPRYALIARHRDGAGDDVTVAEDLTGQAAMQEVRALICAALGIPLDDK